MKLHSDIIDIKDLTSQHTEVMYQLMTRHYDNVSRGVFDSDLYAKDRVILLKEQGGEIVGFSTVKLLTRTINQQELDIVFSGDTIIDRQYWGSTALPVAFGQMMLDIADNSDNVLYWYLISKGFRTYRYLPVFYHEFYPRANAAIPELENQILYQLGTEMFGSKYDHQRQIIYAGPDYQKLKAGVGDIDESRLDDEHVSFFAQANPGHTRGDELTCIARFDRDNLTEFIKRRLNR